MKIKGVSNVEGMYTFWCPGCEERHSVWTVVPNPNTGARWTFSGTVDNPTFSPSLNVSTEKEGVKGVCHFHVINGSIQYCSDCTHPLAGKTVTIIDLD